MSFSATSSGEGQFLDPEATAFQRDDGSGVAVRGHPERSPSRRSDHVIAVPPPDFVADLSDFSPRHVESASTAPTTGCTALPAATRR
jgi:hypothetical protein